MYRQTGVSEESHNFYRTTVKDNSKMISKQLSGNSNQQPNRASLSACVYKQAYLTASGRQVHRWYSAIPA